MKKTCGLTMSKQREKCTLRIRRTAIDRVDQWSYNKMDEIMDGLAGQLTMKQNLNGGLLIQFSFNE